MTKEQGYMTEECCYKSKECGYMRRSLAILASLTAPTRGAMQQMLQVCDDYAVKYNISFSTDPNPSKSKSKCIFFVGNKKNMVKSAPLVLAGRELPWAGQLKS